MRHARLVSVFLFLVLPVFFLMHCASPQSDAPLRDAPIALTWQVESHLEVPNTFTSTLTLTNTDAAPLGASGWTMYFNFIRLIDTATVSDQVKITHINGDFFKMEPTENFPALAQGEATKITFRTAFWAVKKSDAPAGFYMVYSDMDGNDLPPQPVSNYTVGAFETAAQTMRSPADVLPVPTPTSRYRDNATLTLIDAAELPPVVPTPNTWSRGTGTFEVSASTLIGHDPALEKEAAHLAAALGQGLISTPTTAATETEAPIQLSMDAGMADDRSGAYALSISDTGVSIVGVDAAGVFYGIQSLRALIPVDAFNNPADAFALPTMEISDGPRFPYRGLHIDVSRNFHTKESILQVLDLMGFYKLNKFHFHLTDDEGWRLEIDGLPELTEVGSRRGHTLDESTHLYPSLGSGPDPDVSNGTGYYTRKEFIEILRYATDRHIEVIPEIDVPGHARAAIRSMEVRYNRLSAEGDEEAASRYRLAHPADTSTYASVQMWNDNVIDVCQPSTYAFLEKVVDDVVAMYTEAGVTLETVHIGNDEVPHGVWQGSPACQALSTTQYNDYFLQKMSEMLTSRGLNLAGWEEIALTADTAHGSAIKVPNPTFLNSNFRPYVWNAVWGWGSEGTAYTLANAGYQIVLSNATNLYFDFAYDKDPEEPGFYWAGFVNTQKAFAFNPFNLYQNAQNALFGQPIDASTVYRDFPRLTPEGKQNIMGIQGQLWSESAKGAALLEYQLFPKVLGLAERAWAAAPDWVTIDNDASRTAAEFTGWNVFANQIGQSELPRLDALWGIRYRIPPPGISMDGASTVANVAFPGLTLHYTTEKRLPTAEDPIYAGPVPFIGQINVAAFASNGRSSRPASLGTNPLGN
ncbi:MAG: family 20 glycosylhydrolase [Bacteroidota bacterium]